MVVRGGCIGVGGVVGVRFLGWVCWGGCVGVGGCVWVCVYEGVGVRWWGGEGE